MSLSNADRQALDAQYRQWNYERIHLGLDSPEWDRFIAWRTAVAMEKNAEMTHGLVCAVEDGGK